MKAWLREGFELAAAAWRRRPPGRFWLVFLSGVIVAVLCALPFEKFVESQCPGAAGRFGFWAEKLSFWGDFLPGTLPLSLLFLIVGTLARKTRWRRIGWAILLAAAVAGIPASTLRMTMGRPRPTATTAGMHDGFYGIHRPEFYHSFPSGHSATSFATAGALGAAVPPLLPVALVGAGCVCWSRAYLQRHHLSDLIVGASFGLLVGLHFGRTARSFKKSP